VADLRISELPLLPGAALAAAELLPLTDVSASQTKRITAKDLIQYGVTLIDANSIPSDKFDIVLPDGSVTEAMLADRSVTAAKLDDNSSCVVDVGVPAAGVRIGQLAVDTNENKLYAWSGSQWLEVKAAGSVNTITPDLTGLVVIAVDQTGDTVALDAELANTAGARQFLAGPTASGGTVTQRIIVSADLPTATATEQGAVLPGTSLKVDANGILDVNNSVVPQDTRSLATWNEFGLVTGGTPIEGSDLPPATPVEPGVVYPGPGLDVDPNGQIFIDNTMVPGTYPKVTVNDLGLVIAGGPLEADDILNIDAGAINTGELDPSVIADRSIEEIKLADYSTCQMQEDNPGSGYKLGHFWWQPSTAQLRIFARGSGPENVWRPVGFGALQANNLRWGGVIDANLGTIVSVTSIGLSENLVAGQPIPPPSDSLSGMYFVTQVEGNNIPQPNVSGTTFTPGDWLLCINASEGYVHIDAGAASGGGGGGTVNYLDDLLDVEIGGAQGPFGVPRVALTDGQFLYYDGNTGMWVNSDVVDGGTF
jgi:hypothetical protein